MPGLAKNKIPAGLGTSRLRRGGPLGDMVYFCSPVPVPVLVPLALEPWGLERECGFNGSTGRNCGY